MKNIIDEWLDFKLMNEGKAASTIVKYRYYLTLLTTYFAEQSLTVQTVAEKDLEQFVGLYLHTKKLAPQSRRTAVAAVKGFFEYAFKHNFINNDPAKDVPYPTGSGKIPVAMGLKNFEKLLQNCNLEEFLGIRDAAIIAMLGGCGLRLSGLTGLNQSSLLWYEHDGKERLAIKTLEKGSKERMLPVPREAHLYLRAYLGHPELKTINRRLHNGDEVLFVSTRNRTVDEANYYGEARRISSRSVQDMITMRGEAAGVDANQCHPHALRHLTGTEYAEEEVDLLMRQQLLGHADPSTTAIYTQLAMRRLTTTIDRANPLAKVTTAVSPLVSKM